MCRSAILHSWNDKVHKKSQSAGYYIHYSEWGDIMFVISYAIIES